MNCQRINDELLLEALHDDPSLLPPATADAVRAHLAACASCRAQLATLEQITAHLADLPPTAVPTQRMRANFDAMLAREKRTLASSPSSIASEPSRLDSFFAKLLPRRPAFQFASALALLALGLFVGSRFHSSDPKATSPNPQAAANATAATSAIAASAAELAELREQVNNMGRLVTYSLLQQKSTSERLQSVLATLQLKTPDRQLLTDLVGTLAFDPSVNVRLSVVEALAPHTNEDVVRAGLIAALPRETAPLVQVAMIELLASINDVEAAPAFARLMVDDRADPSVRETARRALALLNIPRPARNAAPQSDAPASDTFSHTPAVSQTTT